MELKLENLELIETIHSMLVELRDRKVNEIEKRWLTTTELSKYIGYGKDSINKMIQEQKFICGIHYYKKVKKILFDKQQVDNWIMGIESNKLVATNNENITNDIILSLVS